MEGTNPHLVPHYGEVVHPQVSHIHKDLPQSLGRVGVKEYSGMSPLLVDSVHPQAELSDWLQREEVLSEYSHGVIVEKRQWFN